MVVDDGVSRGRAHQLHHRQQPFRKPHRDLLITADFLLKHNVGDILRVAAAWRQTAGLDDLRKDLRGDGLLFVLPDASPGADGLQKLMRVPKPPVSLFRLAAHQSL